LLANLISEESVIVVRCIEIVQRFHYNSSVESRTRNSIRYITAKFKDAR